MARPRRLTDADLRLIETMAALDCTKDEIASEIGCDPSLLSKPNYSILYDKGRQRGKTSLRRMLFKQALAGRDSVLIFLAKNRLDYHDNVKQEISAKIETTSRVEELVEWVNRLNKVT